MELSLLLLDDEVDRTSPTKTSPNKAMSIHAILICSFSLQLWVALTGQNVGHWPHLLVLDITCRSWQFCLVTLQAFPKYFTVSLMDVRLELPQSLLGNNCWTADDLLPRSPNYERWPPDAIRGSVVVKLHTLTLRILSEVEVWREATMKHDLSGDFN